MKIQPTLHWNNFTVPELKEILEHCTALERLGIAQDEQMMCSIERDIALRKEKPRPSSISFKSRARNKVQNVTLKHPQEILLEQTA